MASGKVLRQLITAGANGDIENFRRVTEAVIQDERQKQHHLLANDLEKILYGEHLKSEKPLDRNVLPLPPTDKEQGLPLLDMRHPQRSLEQIIVNKNTHSAIDELIEENRRADLLQSYGMKPSKKVLFY